MIDTGKSTTFETKKRWFKYENNRWTVAAINYGLTAHLREWRTSEWANECTAPAWIAFWNRKMRVSRSEFVKFKSMRRKFDTSSSLRPFHVCGDKLKVIDLCYFVSTKTIFTTLSKISCVDLSGKQIVWFFLLHSLFKCIWRHYWLHLHSNKTKYEMEKKTHSKCGWISK